MSIYHSWYFRDRVRLTSGGPVVDLLNGGTIGAGGQARHKIEFNTGVIDNGVGVRLSGSWISPTKITETSDDTGTLRYSSLVTFDLRLFINLGQRFEQETWTRNLRASLSLGNIFNARQKVRDASGATPQIYQPAFLDAYGRTVAITLRKML